MDALMQIHLNNVVLYGFHGVHPEEAILGGEFEVNLTASYKPVHFPITEIKQTVDYTVLLEIVKQRMAKRAELLESLATEIGNEIFDRFSIVSEIVLSIQKLHPPIEKFKGSVGVTVKMKKN